MQLQEAVIGITPYEIKKTIIITNDDLIPAQRLYERVEFVISQRRKKQNIKDFVDEY